MPLERSHYLEAAGLGRGNCTTLNAVNVPLERLRRHVCQPQSQEAHGISDGSSNTLMMAEVSGRSAGGADNNQYANSWVGSCCVSRLRNPERKPCSTGCQMSSNHTGIVNCRLAISSCSRVKGNIPRSTTDSTVGASALAGVSTATADVGSVTN